MDKVQAYRLDFLKAVLPAAATACPPTNVPPQVCVAQAALETGWGGAKKAVAQGLTFQEFGEKTHWNLFGIKGTGNAGTQVWPTKEYVGVKGKDGHYKVIDDNFAAYSSLSAGVQAHCRFFDGGFYKKAKVLFPKDPAWFLTWIWAGGYATEPEYVTRVVGVMQSIASMTHDESYKVTLDAELSAIVTQLQAVKGGSLRRARREALMGKGKPVVSTPTPEPLQCFDPEEANALYSDIMSLVEP